jgi:hypothetical protein
MKRALEPKNVRWLYDGPLLGNHGYSREDGVTAISGIHPSLPDGSFEYCVSIGHLKEVPSDELCREVIADFGFADGWTEDNSGTMSGLVRCFWRPVEDDQKTPDQVKEGEG